MTVQSPSKINAPQNTEPEVKRPRHFEKVNCLNLFKLILAALPTIVFGVFTIIFSIQQEQSAQATREQDQRIADEINRRTIFKEYIDDMKELLLNEKFQGNINKSLIHIRVQTLTVLRVLDPNRKRDVVRFLYENQLIRKDQTPLVDLRGADLNGMKFVRSPTESCDFHSLYLPGIYGQDMIFDGCSLVDAVFDGASMAGSNFHSCHLIAARFHQANLTKAQLHVNHMFMINMSGADLRYSHISGGFFQGADISNVDFYGSHMTEDIFQPSDIFNTLPNNFANSRLPNGSFVNLNTSNLLPRSETTSKCEHNSSHDWIEIISFDPASLIKRVDIEGFEENPIMNECVYLARPKQTMGKASSVAHFSYLIDSNQGNYNFSSLIGMFNAERSDRIVVNLVFSEEEGTFDLSKSHKRIVEDPMSIRYHTFSGRIPVNTRFIFVSLECGHRRPSTFFCIFDNVHLSVFQATA